MGQGQVELNVIPLIDVVFFLLVFYVISTSFVQEAAVGVQRPQSSRATTVTEGFVPVTVVRSGAIHVGDRVVDISGAPAEVANALGRANLDRVVVIPDREVPTGVTLAVMDACAAGGAKHVDLAASREAP